MELLTTTFAIPELRKVVARLAKAASRLHLNGKVEPKAGDPFFAFYSRPTKASAVS